MCTFLQSRITPFRYYHIIRTLDYIDGIERYDVQTKFDVNPLTDLKYSCAAQLPPSVLWWSDVVATGHTGFAAAASGPIVDGGFLLVIKIRSTHFLRRGSKAVGPLS
jgi:hypothetical protein